MIETSPATSAPARPSFRSLGRRVGLLYLLQSLPAPFALLIVPGRIFVAGDVAATAERVRENAMLLRVAIAAELWSCLVLVLAAIALYRLLRRVDQYLAVVTAALVCVAVPVQLANLVNHLAPLVLTSGSALPSAFTKGQVDGLTYLFVRLHGLGLQIAQVFWGLWLIPWGVAAMRSAIMPRWLAVAMMAAGVGYVLRSAVTILAPQLAPAVLPFLGLLALGEIATLVWLLAWGAREPRASALRPANL
jgi:hypothetical protein